MDYEMQVLLQEGYIDHPEDRDTSNRFMDICDDLVAKGYTENEAMHIASKRIFKGT